MPPSPAHRLVTPTDDDAPRRVERWRKLGLRQAPDPELDEISRIVAQSLDAPLGMINLVGPEFQFLAGLHPSSQQRGVTPEADPMRSIGCDTGYCIYTVTRKHALALDEVLDYHRFAGNPIIETLGTRAYLGAPLLDHEGEALGTLCVVDLKPHKWTNDDVAFIKAKAVDVVNLFYRRAAHNGVG